MRSEAIIKRFPLIALSILSLSAFALGLLLGCSAQPDANGANEGGPKTIEEYDPENATYEPIQEKILDSICANYSEWGIGIRSIELSAGLQDRARIELEFADRSDEQTALAGLCILNDNFPKLQFYTTKIGGAEYSTGVEELVYIRDTGYDFGCGAEMAEHYLSIIETGIPDDGDLINAESS